MLAVAVPDTEPTDIGPAAAEVALLIEMLLRA
jgi:hypothetical protein